jgi:ribose transport system permease protein
VIPVKNKVSGSESEPSRAIKNSEAGTAAAPRRLNHPVERFAGVGVLVLLLVVFTVTLPGQFLTSNNVIGVVGNQAISGVVALGLVAPLAAGVFDISVQGVMTLSIVAVTDLFQATNGHIAIPLAIAIVLVGAVLVGGINAAFVLKLGVDPFIATIGTGSVLEGISQMIANGTTITNNIPTGFTALGRSSLFTVPIDVYIFVGLAFVVWYVLTYTPFGPSLYSTGAAREAARLAGIRTNRVITAAFCMSALMAAVAGVLFAAQTGSGPPGVGSSYLLAAYSTAYLGSTIIRPGRFNVVGLIVALSIIAFGVNGLQLAGLPFWVTETFQGTALLVAVVLGKTRKSKP